MKKRLVSFAKWLSPKFQIATKPCYPTSIYIKPLIYRVF